MKCNYILKYIFKNAKKKTEILSIDNQTLYFTWENEYPKLQRFAQRNTGLGNDIFGFDTKSTGNDSKNKWVGL